MIFAVLDWQLIQLSIKWLQFINDQNNVDELTLVSEWWIRTARAGRISRTMSTCGGGSLLRQRFTITHVTLRRNDSGTVGLTKEMSGFTMPRDTT